MSQIVDADPAVGTSSQEVPSPPSRFRPDIEGLRAIAVVAVLAYHAGVPGFGGGFVGVDVFFVISGFLITGQMLRDVDGRGLRFREFYARRARRLLPAATVVIIATLAGSALVLSPLLQASAGADARAAALFFSNMRFAGQATDYFAQTQDPSPFLHFWSLSVEEQFYLVWPALVLAALIGAGRSAAAHRRRLAVVLAVIVVLSFAGCVWLTSYSQPWAFFWLAPRAWELALGALLAVGAGRIARIRHPLRPVAGWVGLAAVVVSVVVYSDRLAWPGVLAAVPVVGTAAAIAAGIGTELVAGASVGRLLALRPFQVVGRYSYSLYLWHWPVLILGASVFHTISTNWVKASGVIVVVAVPAALVSYHLVEDPVRHAPMFKPARAALVLGAGLIVASLAASVLYGAVTVSGRLDAGRPAPISGAEAIGSGLPATDFVPSDLTPGLADLGAGLGATTTAACPEVDAGEPPLDCILGAGTAPPTIVLFGDSHAAHWAPAFEAYADRTGNRVRRLVAANCGSILYPPTGSTIRDCDGWRDRAFAVIERDRPALVVLSNQSYKGFLRDAAQWESGVRAAIERVSPATRVVILGDTPWGDDSIPECLARHLDDTAACEPAPDGAQLRQIDGEQARIAADEGAGFIDATSWVCTDERCPAVVGNILVYRDADHLSVPFVLTRVDLLQAALDEQLAAAGGG